jgi:carboxyl-terminal processing protease
VGSDRDEPGPLAHLRRILWFAVPLALAAAAFVRWFQAPPSGDSTLAWDDRARREVQSVVERRFVEPLTKERAEALFDAAMKGYVERLDPFSRYFTAAERGALDEDTSGKFGGVGIRVEPVPAGLLIVAVRRGGPADAAGVVPGETVERIGTEAVTGRGRDQVIDMIRGPEGTDVEMWLRAAPGGELRRVAMKRARLDLDTVPSVRTIEGAQRIGYLRLAQFTDTTAADARDAVSGMAAAGVSGIVLDLRRNLGGVVSSAVDVAGIFLPPGSLVCVSRARDGAHAYRTAEADAPPVVTLPLVLLVDESSASASEILAGALQDHGRAVLVGGRTYGKFVMQAIVPLADRGATLRLTTARYETPRGRSCQRDPHRGATGGLCPDVRVPLATDEEQRALGIEFARQAGPAWKVMDGRDPASDPPDPQLGAALALLRGGAAPAEPVPPR